MGKDTGRVRGNLRSLRTKPESQQDLEWTGMWLFGSEGSASVLFSDVLPYLRDPVVELDC